MPAAMSFGGSTLFASCARDRARLRNRPDAPARQAIAEELPEAVAAAVIDFTTTALINNSHRVGTPLSNGLDGVWSARRGTYRALYRINQERREVVVLRIDRRRDAYRPLS